MEHNDLENRVYYLDFVRIIAIISVIVLHVSAYFWTEQKVDSFNWNVMNLYDSFVRYSVPLFVMISGAIWLNPSKKISIKKIYKKNILNIVIVFIFWSILYALLESLFIGTGSVKEFIIKCINGHYHMWFLYMIVGMYILIPLLRMITVDEDMTKYFLIIFYIASILIPSIKDTDFLLGFKSIIGYLNPCMDMGYIFYFVLGYYISKKDIKKRNLNIIYILGIVGFISILVLTKEASIKYNTSVEYYYEMRSIFAAAESIAMFIFLKNISKHFLNHKKLRDIIVKVSECTFGIYLIHDLAIQLLLIFGLSSTSFNPVFSIPIISLLVFIISLFFIIILKRIKIVNRYIL